MTDLLNLDVIVSIFIKVLMVMLTIMGLVMTRQSSLMNRVVSVPIGGWFKNLGFVYFWICLVLTLGIIIVV